MILVALLILAQASAPADSGCSADRDCKGNRVCVKKQCVWPKDAPAATEPELERHDAPAPVQPAPAAPPPLVREREPAPPLLPAPRPPPPPAATTRFDTAPARHDGFYFRVDGGLGYLTTSTSSGSTDVTVSGLTYGGGLHLGFSVKRNVILGVQVSDNIVSSPGISVNGTSMDAKNDASYALQTLGPELTLYSAGNFYLTFTLGAARLHASSGNDSVDSDIGLGAGVAAGKEWFVGDKLGLGVGLQLRGAVTPSGQPNVDAATTLFGGVGASLTFN